MTPGHLLLLLLMTVVVLVGFNVSSFGGVSYAASASNEIVTIDWNRVVVTSKTTPTLQVSPFLPFPPFFTLSFSFCC